MTDQVPVVARMDVQDLKHALGSSLEFLKWVGRTPSTTRCASSDTERSLTNRGDDLFRRYAQKRYSKEMFWLRDLTSFREVHPEPLTSYNIPQAPRSCLLPKSQVGG